MKTRAVILAGGEGARLSILTAKRTKPAVPFAGKYRIIDFALSNCVNSGLFDVMILVQYRPHSLIEHIGAGGPWDLNRDFTGGVRIFTPYKARRVSDWYLGTADAVQQNFGFIKSTNPDLVLVLSGDHIYEMNYDALIAFHIDHQADVTLATIRVPLAEASRFGILGVDDYYRVTTFIEKPDQPVSNLANMGVYLFNLDVLDRALWEDHKRSDSSHDFGKDVIPYMLANGFRVYTFPFTGYWVDVGTVESYWQAHMDMLADPPRIDLSDRSWIIHTRTEERCPARIASGAQVHNSLISDGCVLHPNSIIERSILSPGVRVFPGAVVRESILLTDTIINSGAVVERSILDKRVNIGAGAHLGGILPDVHKKICLVGKNSQIPAGFVMKPGAVVDTDVVASDFFSNVLESDAFLQPEGSLYEV